EMVDVSVREDSSNPKSLEKIERADLIFFTGGNQLNVTSLFGGSPMHELFKKRIREGVVVAGTSAGAAMMSTAMIMRGTGDAPPSAQAVELGPGLDLAYGTLIDTHFSQRGRHGRLMTAIAHDPQLVGIGLDEETAAVFRGDTLEVVGNGSVTIVDGTAMSHTDLVYVERGTPIGILDMRIHVLAEGYKYDLTKKLPSAPPIAAAA
ncbi:MAG: cyanophycinase, partial [Acidobacteria bacterium]|nr:cyanophycinase [Acidobacteriota bacterium]